MVFVEVTKLTGLSSEEGTYLRGVLGSTVNLRGMLLAGIVIGALGVLNDVTVTQASAVWEIHRANPPVDAGRPVPRRPCASAGTTSPPPSTPWSWPTPAPPCPCSCSSPWPTGAWATSSPARSWPQEIVQTLVGSLGLIAAVPVTTWLACVLVTRMVPAPAGA